MLARLRGAGFAAGSGALDNSSVVLRLPRAFGAFTSGATASTGAVFAARGVLPAVFGAVLPADALAGATTDAAAFAGVAFFALIATGFGASIGSAAFSSTAGAASYAPLTRRPRPSFSAIARRFSE